MRLSCLVSPFFAASAIASSNLRFFPRQNSTPPSTAGYELKKGPLDTDWTSKVGTNPWPEHPRPLLVRKDWKNLNGVWEYQNVSDSSRFNSPPFGTALGQSVLVPFCLESALSGIMGEYHIHSWYRTIFDVPSSWPAGNRVLLNFDAVDYQTTVYVNGKNVTSHTGGYDAFSVDITDQLSKNGTNELFVAVYDPTDINIGDEQVQIPIGKQTLRPSHIFYTPCSGIWQTVWLESAPPTHISELHMSADMHGTIDITAKSNDGSSPPVDISVWEPESHKLLSGTGSTSDTATAQGKGDSTFRFTAVSSPKLWSPDSPTLYNVTVKMGKDVVQSYIGFRTISKGEVNGVQRPLLNGKFLFQFGTLDQGFWPDGIYTPPSVEAMRYDLEVLKKIGYNMVRKHIKVEPALFYKACDELGLLVIQDMPSLRTFVRNPKSEKSKNCDDNQPVGYPEATAEFGRQLEIMVNQHKSYPSLVTWTIYNEEWGQPKDNGDSERRFTDMVRKADPTRLINTVSGWFDHGAGDFHDNHHYSDPQCGTPFYSKNAVPYDPKRIGLQGEFAGIGHNVSIEHLWNVNKALTESDQTYEVDASIEIWNYRAHILLAQLESQIERFACSGAVWTQTTDVEGEINGMLSYDRRVLRPDLAQWNKDIQALYAVAEKRAGNATMDDVSKQAPGWNGINKISN